MSYYGLAMNPNFMGGDRYLSFIIGGVLEIVAVVIILFTVNHIGRKLMVFCGFLFAALCLFTTLALPMGEQESSSSLRLQYNKETARMILVIVGKMLLTAVYAILYVYTPELFPTVIRSTAMGSCSMIARLGGTAASYLSMWLADISKETVAIIFGVSCVISALSSLALPETAGQHQLETLEQAEEFGKNQSILSFRAESKSKRSAKNVAKENNNNCSENESKDEKSTENEKTPTKKTITTT
uniref:Major facilitator superfamily (MFS) profile domain-containing protein n=1 Tax=Romanomermis culicivorax TaxID=13658 RepID=A0A915I701_ROMCU